MIKNILLAEDDRGTSLLVKTQLERYGYRVSTAENGLEALNILQSEKIDLVITDVVMPEMDGVDFYMAMKQDATTASLPVIIVTDKQVFKDSFAALGVDHFVPKTSDISNLIEKIHTVEVGYSPMKNYTKALVGGTHSVVLVQMQTLLGEKGCLVSTADKSADFLSKCFLMKPHLILLDVAMHDDATAADMIRSLRCYDFLKKATILVYSFFSPEEAGQVRDILGDLEGRVADCLASGANRYIGRFNRMTFMDQIGEFLIEGAG